MNEITTVGLDLAKNVFQVHGVDAEGTTVLRKQLRRAQLLAFFSRQRSGKMSGSNSIVIRHVEFLFHGRPPQALPGIINP